MIVSSTEFISNGPALSESRLRLLERYRRGNFPVAAFDASRIVRRPPDAPAPLSPNQEEIWRHSQSTQGMPAFYNESITIHRHGPMDVRILRQCMTEIVRRHEAWRTTFDLVNGRPVQIIHPPPSEFPLPAVDLRELPEADREVAALELATEMARKPFDLSKGPLVRAALVTLGDDRHQIFLTVHQIVVDGLTVNVLFPSELSTLYDALCNGKASQLPELPIQFADYACWHQQWLQSDGQVSQLSYWKNQLADLPPAPNWPGQLPRQAVASYRGAIVPFQLSSGLSSRLKKVCSEEGVTMFMKLFAGFSALVWRKTGQDDLLLGTLAPVGRDREETENLIGYFLNPVPLRIKLSRSTSVRQLLLQAQSVVSEAIANDDVPLGQMMSKLGIKTDAEQHPPFRWIISLAPPLAPLGSGWSQTFMDVESGGSKWDLYLELREGSDGLLGRAQFNPDVFDAATIFRMVQDWQELLEAMASKLDSPISELLPLRTL